MTQSKKLDGEGDSGVGFLENGHSPSPQWGRPERGREPTKREGRTWESDPQGSTSDLHTNSVTLGKLPLGLCGSVPYL